MNDDRDNTGQGLPGRERPASDPLLERYRRESAGDAGTPSAATRAAILREARAAALRGTPAANDSHWKLRMVAALAVVGLGAWWWRLAEQPELKPTALGPAQAPVSAPALPSAHGPALPSAPAPVSAQTAAVRSPMPASEAEPPPSVAKAERPNEIRENATRASDKADSVEATVEATAEAKVVREYAAVPAPADAAPAGSLAKRESMAVASGGEADASEASAAALFPEAWNGTESVEVWVVYGADGSVLASGQLPPSASIDNVYAEFARSHPGMPLLSPKSVSLRNARGASLVLHTVRVRST